LYIYSNHPHALPGEIWSSTLRNPGWRRQIRLVDAPLAETGVFQELRTVCTPAGIPGRYQVQAFVAGAEVWSEDLQLLAAGADEITHTNLAFLYGGAEDTAPPGDSVLHIRNCRTLAL
jgi:hypothetical protein